MFVRKFVVGPCLGLMLVTASAPANELGRRYLVVDQLLHGAAATLNFTTGQASGAQQQIKMEQAWEVSNNVEAAWVNGVVPGPDNVYRMYCTLRNSGGKRSAT